jgi:hypothetical protein
LRFSTVTKIGRNVKQNLPNAMQQCCYLDHGIRINLGDKVFSSLSQYEFRVYFTIERNATMLPVLGPAGFETWTEGRPS